MPEVVSNSTPLIHLAKIGHLRLLPELFGTIVIPQAVYAECVLDGKPYQDAQAIAQADWLEVREVADKNLIISLAADLDRGEAEAIALALQTQSSLLLLDDAEGRSKARLYGLKHTGTIGILLKAKLENRIPSLRDALNILQETGFWLHSRLYQKLIQEAGE